MTRVAYLRVLRAELGSGPIAVFSPDMSGVPADDRVQPGTTVSFEPAITKISSNVATFSKTGKATPITVTGVNLGTDASAISVPLYGNGPGV